MRRLRSTTIASPLFLIVMLVLAACASPPVATSPAPTVAAAAPTQAAASEATPITAVTPSAPPTEASIPTQPPAGPDYILTGLPFNDFYLGKATQRLYTSASSEQYEKIDDPSTVITATKDLLEGAVWTVLPVPGQMPGNPMGYGTILIVPGSEQMRQIFGTLHANYELSPIDGKRYLRVMLDAKTDQGAQISCEGDLSLDENPIEFSVGKFEVRLPEAGGKVREMRLAFKQYFKRTGGNTP
jgi:hypothetical protein